MSGPSWGAEALVADLVAAAPAYIACLPPLLPYFDREPALAVSTAAASGRGGAPSESSPVKATGLDSSSQIGTLSAAQRHNLPSPVVAVRNLMEQVSASAALAAPRRRLGAFSLVPGPPSPPHSRFAVAELPPSA